MKYVNIHYEQEVAKYEKNIGFVFSLEIIVQVTLICGLNGNLMFEVWIIPSH